jgi:hypothetical protein
MRSLFAVVAAPLLRVPAKPDLEMKAERQRHIALDGEGGCDVINA